MSQTEFADWEPMTDTGTEGMQESQSQETAVDSGQSPTNQDVPVTPTSDAEPTTLPQEGTPSETKEPAGEGQESTPPQTADGGEDSPERDIEELRKQLAEAQLRILQLQGVNPDTGQTKAPEQSQPQQAATNQEQKPTFEIPKSANEVTNVDFLQGQDHVSLLEDAGKFNQLLNRVATVAFNAAVMASQERILRQIPQVVETTAQQQMQIRGIVDKFYTSNKDLEPYKPAVSMAAVKLHNDNPKMGLEEILAKAADETRKVLRIRPQTSQRPRVPAQPVGGGKIGSDRTQTAPKLSDMEQQIVDLLNF